jgi:hypothetical protein
LSILNIISNLKLKKIEVEMEINQGFIRGFLTYFYLFIFISSGCYTSDSGPGTEKCSPPAKKIEKRICDGCDPDLDEDGICDSLEDVLGTDPNIRDIFVEIDWMPNKFNKKGMNITKKALQLIENAFLKRNIVIHFDAGTYFDANSVSPDPENYNFGGGNEVPYTSHLTTLGVECWEEYLLEDETCENDFVTVQQIKENNFDFSRQFIFHYLVIGDYADDEYTVGVAEWGGNDFVMTNGDNYEQLGITGPDKDLREEQYINNSIAATIMHELGHNLSLTHGGSEEDAYVNSKPNYESIMNYVYADFGLNVKGSGEQWQEFNWLYGFGCEPIDALNCDPEIEYCSFLSYDLTYTDIVIDYSPGSNLPLDEWNVIEIHGYSPGIPSPVDFSCDNNFSSTAQQIDLSLDVNDLGVHQPIYTVINDYNDWDNLILPIYRYQSGQTEKPNSSKNTYLNKKFDESTFIRCYSPEGRKKLLENFGYIPEVHIRVSE